MFCEEFNHLGVLGWCPGGVLSCDEWFCVIVVVSFMALGGVGWGPSTYFLAHPLGYFVSGKGHCGDWRFLSEIRIGFLDLHRFGYYCG